MAVAAATKRGMPCPVQTSRRRHVAGNDRPGRLRLQKLETDSRSQFAGIAMWTASAHRRSRP
jgi:hypothetical protein